VADLPQACDESQAFPFTGGPLANGIVLAGCGQWPNAVSDVFRYDLDSNIWANAGQIRDNRRNQAGAAVPMGGGHVGMYILGGYGENSGFLEPIRAAEFGGREKPGGGSGAPSHPGSTTSTQRPTTT
jgi:hypothetical protein